MDKHPIDNGKKNGEWNFHTLALHINALFKSAEERTSDRFASAEKAVAAALASAEKAVSAALVAQEKAVSLADENADRWRANANEWRSAMDDREEKFVKVGEFTLILQQIKDLREAISTMVKRSEFSQALDQIKSNKDQLSTIAGRGQGLEAGWKILLGLGTLLSIAVALYLAFKGAATK